MENARKDRIFDEEKAEEYEREARNSEIFLMTGYYNYKADYYWKMAEKDSEIYNYWKEKSDRYDEIENSTYRLFSTSEATRAIAYRALESITKAFVDGCYKPDMGATWRTEIVECYFNRVMTVSKDGNISINFAEVEKILCKDADDILPQEYDAIVLAYLNANDEDLGKILQYMMKRKIDKNVPLINEIMGPAAGQMNQDYSEWLIDKKKMKEISNRVSYSAESMLYIIRKLRNTSENDLADDMVIQRSVMLQRLTLLNVAAGLETFRGDYKAKYPTIGVKKGNDGELILNFCEYKNVGSVVSPTFSNIGKSTVTISKNILSSQIDDTAVSNLEYKFARYFGNYSIAEESTKFIVDEMTGELVGSQSDKLGEYVTKTMGKETLGNAIGYIPIVGDVISFSMDVAQDSAQAKADAEFIKEQFGELKSALVYEDFDCTACFIEYDISDNDSSVICAYPGELTDKIISEINDAFGTKLTREQIISEPDETRMLIQEIVVNDNNRGTYDKVVKNKSY